MEITTDAMTLTVAMKNINGHKVISYETEHSLLFIRLLDTGWHVIYAPFVFQDKRVIVGNIHGFN